VTVPVDGQSDEIAFVVGDSETDPAELVVTGESDNADLVAEDGIVIAGEGENRTIQIVPVAGATGTATITVSVSDGELTTTETFMVTVEEAAENTAPTLAELGDVTVPVDGQSDEIAFVVGDAETDPAELVVTGESDNADLVAAEGIIIAGEGENRTIQIVPVAGATGTATITVSVSDGELTTTETFMVTVEEAAENTAPTLAELGDVTVPVDGQSDEIAFVVGDAETDPADLVVTGESDNADLVAEDGIIIAGEGENRTIQIVPVAGATGTATITVSVSDGELTTSTTFLVSVTLANIPPTVTEIDDVTIPVDGDSGVIEFAVNDEETLPGDLLVQVSSDNEALIASGDLVLGGEGENRTLVITPQAGMSGTATITVSVSDGADFTETTFVVTVSEVEVNAPEAQSDAYSTPADTSLSISAVGVLENDEAGDNGPLSISEVNGEAGSVGEMITLDSGAQLRVNADGSFDYDPSGAFADVAVGEVAVDSFTYTAVDGEGNVTSATVEVSVEGVLSGTDPFANDDTYYTDASTALTITTSGVLNNDEGGGLVVTEVNGDPAALGTSIALDSGALLTLNTDGSLTYDPNGVFGDVEVGSPATDSFAYTMVDSNGVEADAVVVIMVEAPNGEGDLNLPPINTIPGQQETDSNGSIVFTPDDGTGISISDADAENAIIETTISVDSGLLMLNGGFSSSRHKLVGTMEQ
ncbi:MAG: Ig-like domain-containing protein, partial [Pirellulaceae bacterium]